MFLPPIRRLLVDDFPGQKEWIGKLLNPLNQVFQPLSAGLNHQITLPDNVACMTPIVTFSNNSAELSSTHPIRIKNTLVTKPALLFVGKVKDITSSPQALSGAVFPTWDYDDKNNQITVSALTGLVANQRYQVSFLIF